MKNKIYILSLLVLILGFLLFNCNNSQDESYWDKKGVALSDTGKYEQAIEAFNRALEIKPDYYKAWKNKGIALRKFGKYKEAIEAYDKALKIKSDYQDALYHKGFDLEECEKYRQLGAWRTGRSVAFGSGGPFAGGNV